MKVGIVGLGYVGLPLCLRFGRAGVEALGFDRDEAKVAKINRRESYIRHIASSELAALIDAGRLRATADLAEIAECQAVLICVPTPLDEQGRPDMDCVFSTGKNLAPYLTEGMTVILESTVYPGATEQELRVILERGSGKRAGRDFSLAYSPEREDPGRSEVDGVGLPKIVAGLTPRCRERAVEFYRRITDQVVMASRCREAEAAKLLENAYRSVNIALANEFKLVCDPLGIDVWEVVELARTKPFGFQAFYPGPGVGGHCIPIDPVYLSWKARQHGVTARLVELAGSINTGMPDYVFEKTAEVLEQAATAMAQAKVLILGIAYKPGVDDDRGSPSYRLMELFATAGASVDYYDPHVPAIWAGRGHRHLAGKQSIGWTRETIASYDVTVIATDHREIAWQELGDWAACIVDTRNVMEPFAPVAGRLVKA